jgi:hypothetical protein
MYKIFHYNLNLYFTSLTDRSLFARGSFQSTGEKDAAAADAVGIELQIKSEKVRVTL